MSREDLNELIQLYRDPHNEPKAANRKRAIERLLLLYRVRNEDGRIRRNRLAVRSRYFWRSFFYLALLVIGLALIIKFGTPGWNVVVTAVAGALRSYAVRSIQNS